MPEHKGQLLIRGSEFVTLLTSVSFFECFQLIVELLFFRVQCAFFGIERLVRSALIVF